MTEILDEVGVPRCPGGVMASEPAFRGSLALWRERIGRWIARSRPEDLLAVDIVFDFRAVHGDLALADGLWRDAWAAAQGETAFLKLLSDNAGDMRGGLGLFGRLKTDEDGRIDVKREGLKGIVTTARVLALRYGVAVRSTHDRLQGVAALDMGGGEDLAAFDEDHAVLLDAILRQQLRDVRAGRPPDNRVDPAILDRRSRSALRDVFARAASLDALRRDLLS
jgi:DNA polymerase-3 subunit epsilon/CBS domain-containing protein